MNEQNYVCPYCGIQIDRDKILFWETVKSQYTDNVRGDFLRRHGVKVSAGNKFPRMYYKVRPDENVTRVDENGYPTMIEDHLGNAIAPADLEKESRAGGFDAFDDDFDSDGFGDDGENRNDRRDRDTHNIPRRACPGCHCELPQQFGMLKTHHVAMFGGRASGKTAYLVNLFQQLKTQLSSNDLGSVMLESESAGFLQPMIDDYERDGTTRPTPADGGLMPILCHYKNKSDEAFITFYDIAGEGTADPAYMANHKGIANCETLMLMIDPNMFVGGAFFQAWNANHLRGEGRYAEVGDCCSEPLDSFLNEAGALCREYSDRIRYIICVVTKIDMLLEAEAKYFSSGDIELVNDIGDEHRGAVSLPALKRVNDNLSLYLISNHRVNLKDKLIYAFGSDMRINLLGVSTSTRVRSGRDEIAFEPRSSAVDKKHRIIEPFLVVLMYFGLVPARNARGEVIKFNDRANEAELPTGEKTPEPPEKPKRGWFGRRK